MRAWLVAFLLLGALIDPAAGREPHRPVEIVRARMEHHLLEVTRIADHFERVLGRD